MFRKDFNASQTFFFFSFNSVSFTTDKIAWSMNFKREVTESFIQFIIFVSTWLKAMVSSSF